MILAIACIAICQDKATSERDRVQAIVDKFINPAVVPGMPDELVTRRAFFTFKPTETRDTHEDDEGEIPVERHACADAFDAWIFGNMSGEGMPKAWLQKRLKEKLVTMGEAYHLTEAHLAKLHLAGSGDIKHYLDEVAEERRWFEDIGEDFKTGRLRLKDLGQFVARFDRGPFGEGSIFDKVFNKIVADRKVAR